MTFSGAGGVTITGAAGCGCGLESSLLATSSLTISRIKFANSNLDNGASFGSGSGTNSGAGTAGTPARILSFLSFSFLMCSSLTFLETIEHGRIIAKIKLNNAVAAPVPKVA